jgi:hypothetical protein
VITMSNQNTAEMCKISVCLNKARENGYCDEHQSLKDTYESTLSRSDTQGTKSSWQPFLVISAIIIILGGIIYGIVNLNEINESVASELISNSVKVRTVIVPVFFTASTSIVLISLGKIISTIEKKEG